MSGLLMGHAFYFDLEPRQKLLLLAIADHANDDGFGAYPGQGRLAEKAGCSERHVRRLLTILENSDLLEVVQKGDGRGHTTHYYLPWAEEVTRGTRRTSKPVKADIQMSTEPSIEPSEDSEPSSESEIPPPSPPPASAQTLVSAFYAAPDNKKVAALIDLAKSQGILRGSGIAAAIIRDFGAGADIVDALFEAVKRARGDLWPYMLEVLQNAQGVQAQGNQVRNSRLDTDRGTGNDGQQVAQGIAANILTAEEARRHLAARASAEGGGGSGPEATSDA